MPQPKSTSGRTKATTSKRTAPRSTTRRKPAAKRPASASRKRAGASGSARASTRSDEALRESLVSLRDHLRRGLVLTGERVQDAVDDAVRRGRITRDDAQDLAESLIEIGRQQTEEVLADLEQLTQSARDVARTAGKRVLPAVESTATRARRAPAADRALREVDRVRRATGIGPTFPIIGYDDLTAAQITGRFEDLAPAELRKVRDYERRHGNRKSVLAALEKALAR